MSFFSNKKQPALLWVCFMLLACSKGDGIPNVPVFYQNALSSVELSNLNNLGGAVSVKGGVAGIIIFRKFDGSMVAYDRCSTVRPELRNPVVIDSSSSTATDTVSGGKFALSDGSPVKAPAAKSLKTYRLTVDNTSNSITVIN